MVRSFQREKFRACFQHRSQQAHRAGGRTPRPGPLLGETRRTGKLQDTSEENGVDDHRNGKSNRNPDEQAAKVEEIDSSQDMISHGDLLIIMFSGSFFQAIDASPAQSPNPVGLPRA
jgi:hypothetical protein